MISVSARPLPLNAGNWSAIGAREVADRSNPDGTGWMVLADPEDNEFCILRSDAEQAGSMLG